MHWNVNEKICVQLSSNDSWQELLLQSIDIKTNYFLRYGQYVSTFVLVCTRGTLFSAHSITYSTTFPRFMMTNCSVGVSASRYISSEELLFQAFFSQLVFGVLVAKGNPWRMCKTTTYILYMLDILFRIITMHCSFRAATPSRIFKAKFMLLCLYCYIAPEGPLWTPKWNTEQNQHLLTQLSCRNIWCIDRFEKRPLRYVDKPLRQQHSFKPPYSCWYACYLSAKNDLSRPAEKKWILTAHMLNHIRMGHVIILSSSERRPQFEKGNPVR